MGEAEEDESGIVSYSLDVGSCVASQEKHDHETEPEETWNDRLAVPAERKAQDGPDNDHVEA